MKRGSSVLQPSCDAAKRLATALAGEDAHVLSVPDGELAADAHAAGSSPFPAATSLFSPDVSTKMASDLLIRLSEATQKAQMHPGSREEAEQQDEPGPALSPDGPGASPEPPSLTHTPDGNAATDTLASDLLRKLAERQEESGLAVRLKEEEEPVEVDAVAQKRPITEEVKTASCHVFAVKTEEEEEEEEEEGDPGGDRKAEQERPRAKMASQPLLEVKREDAAQPAAAGGVPEANAFQFRVKTEDKTEEPLLFRAKVAERPLCRAKMEDELPSGAKMENPLLSGAKTDDQQLFFGAKMEDQCLRAVLWQDMSVNLASTLLHQLSERVGKSGTLQVERMAPPTRTSPAVKVEQLPSSPPLLHRDSPHETQSDLSKDRSASGSSFFFRCHVCGFETEGHALFQSHMSEHRQWEHGSFSLHCCTCDHAANQEAEMRAHVETHLQGDLAEIRCPGTLPAAASSSAPAVAVATQPEKSTSEHRCRICQRSFPGQQELLVHFQGHRQGNQYRCDRCGHLTRTANKLVEHVRVHTGERPFTCDLCPYSAKRRDSLRLHRKVKHAAAAAAAAVHGDAPGDHVHTHRSYVHADNQRLNKHLQRLHTPPSTHASSSSSSSFPPLHPSLSDRAGWRDLSPLLPITTLLSLKPRCSSSSSSSCPPSSSSSSSSLPTKHSFLGYLGLTTSL